MTKGLSLEIERKFLVRSTEYRSLATAKRRILQGFLSTDPKRAVRVRTIGDRAYLTIKGESNISGTSRMEWETEIDTDDAVQLLKLCKPEIIEKMRFEVEVDGFTFEIDEFKGANDGLVVAEIELESETSMYPKPHWLGEEITGQIAYYNLELSKNPYKKWQHEK